MARFKKHSIISIDHRNGDHVYAYTNFGFYKSINGGLSWTKKGLGLPHNQPRDGDYFYEKSTGKYLLDSQGKQISQIRESNLKSLINQPGVYYLLEIKKDKSKVVEKIPFPNP